MKFNITIHGFFEKRLALVDRIYTVNTVSKLLGKTKQNSDVEKNSKQNCKVRFHCFQQFKAVQLCKLELKISFCIVCPFLEAVILKRQFLMII